MQEKTKVSLSGFFPQELPNRSQILDILLHIRKRGAEV